MTQSEADELAWAKAKALAAQRGEAGNWACVMELFTRLRDRVEKAGGPFIGPRGEIIEFRAKHRPVAKGSVHHVPYTFHPVEVEPPRARRVKFPFQGFIDFQGLLIDVENKRGEVRSGTDADGHVWHSKMHAHYGEIRGTEGVDGDKLDVYVGPNADSSLVVVVHQNDPTTGKYDEDKVVLGYRNADEALALYRKQYDRNGFYGGHQVMPIGRFWRWVHDRANYGKRVSGGQIRKALGRIVESLSWVEVDRAAYLRLRSQISKGLAHKYLKRVPTGRLTKTGKPVYRYYYRLSSGAGDILHHEHVRTVGAAFKVEGGHVHIVSADGHGMVTIEHDETEKRETISETDLLRRLGVVHGSARQQWRNELVDKVHDELARVQKHGTLRQQRAAVRRAELAGVAPVVPPTAAGVRAAMSSPHPLALLNYVKAHGEPLSAAVVAVAGERESRSAGDERMMLDEETHSVLAAPASRRDAATVKRMKVPESLWGDFAAAFRALPQDSPSAAPASPTNPEAPAARSLVLHGTDRYGATKIESVSAIVHGDYAIFRYPGGWAAAGWRVAPVVDGKLGRPVSSVPLLNETEGRAWLAGLREEGVEEKDESKLAAVLRDRKADWLQAHAPKKMNAQQSGEFAAAQDALRGPAPKAPKNAVAPKGPPAPPHVSWGQSGGALRSSGPPAVVGDVLFVNGKHVTVTKLHKQYIREDGLSFGLGDDEGWLHTADVRWSTPEEAASYDAARAKEKAARDAKAAAVRSAVGTYSAAVAENTAGLVRVDGAGHRLTDSRVVAENADGGMRSRVAVGTLDGHRATSVSVSMPDDWRDDLWTTPEMAERLHEEHAQKSGITREKAIDFIAAYGPAGTYGAGVYRHVLRNDPDAMAQATQAHTDKTKRAQTEYEERQRKRDEDARAREEQQRAAREAAIALRESETARREAMMAPHAKLHEEEARPRDVVSDFASYAVMERKGDVWSVNHSRSGGNIDWGAVAAGRAAGKDVAVFEQRVADRLRPKPAPKTTTAPKTTAPEPPATTLAGGASARTAREYGLRTTPAGRGDVHVSGNTFPNKDHLKRHGARADRDAAGSFVWRMKASRFEDAMRESGRLQKGLGVMLRGLVRTLVRA